MSEGNTSVSYSAGVGFWPLMFLIFMTLKLTNFIDWSWWWVTAPLWGPIAIVLIFALIACVIGGGLWILAKVLGIK